MKKLFCFMCLLVIFYTGSASAMNDLQQLQRCYIDGSGIEVCPGGGGTIGNISRPFCPDNCATCDSMGKCTTCNAGYFHFTNGADLCVPVDYTLADGSKVTHPIVAYPNYCAQVGQKWISTGAGKTRATAACVDINCEPGKTLTKADGYAVCNQCKTGYTLENNRCISKCIHLTQSDCLSKVANSQSCSKDANGCYVPTCKPGYYGASSYNSSTQKITAYACLSGIAHCTAHQGPSVCKACESGYTLVNNKCLKSTVSGSCPGGLSKSADGCCCIK